MSFNIGFKAPRKQNTKTDPFEGRSVLFYQGVEEDATTKRRKFEFSEAAFKIMEPYMKNKRTFMYYIKDNDTPDSCLFLVPVEEYERASNLEAPENGIKNLNKIKPTFADGDMWNWLEARYNIDGTEDYEFNVTEVTLNIDENDVDSETFVAVQITPQTEDNNSVVNTAEETLDNMINEIEADEDSIEDNEELEAVLTETNN